MQISSQGMVKSTYIDFKPERFFYGLGAVEWVRVSSGDYWIPRCGRDVGPVIERVVAGDGAIPALNT